MTSDICAVVLTCGEATTEASISSIKKITEDVHVIKEAPFSVALQKAYEIGIASGKRWLLKVDADIVLDSFQTRTFISMLDRSADDVYRVVAKLNCKFFDSERCGLSAYKIEHLPKCIKFVEHDKIRAEANVCHRMNDELRYKSITTNICVGRHDYNQSAFDCYRKGYVWSKKLSSRLKSMMSDLWIKKSKSDNDFKYVLRGFERGIKDNMDVSSCDVNTLDRKEVEEELKKIRDKEDIIVVMISNPDYCASGYRIADTVDKNTDITVKQFTRMYGKYMDFPYQFDLSRDLWYLEECLKYADIIHVKGDQLPVIANGHFYLPPTLLEPIAKCQRQKDYQPAIISTVGGSIFRRHGHQNLRAKGKLEPPPIKDYLCNTHIRTALCPDLNYPEFDGIHTPFVHDTESKPITWNPKDIPTICFYPASGNRKGVDSHLMPALNHLRNKGYRFKLTQTINMTNQESIELKSKSTIFYDQVCDTGCYGNSGVEAMQFGIPTITYLSESSLQQANEMFRNSPILNPGYTVEGLIKLFIDIFEQRIDLREVSVKTKEYCDTQHGYSSNAKRWEEIYRNALIEREIRKLEFCIPKNLKSSNPLRERIKRNIAKAEIEQGLEHIDGYKKIRDKRNSLTKKPKSLYL